MLQLSQNIINFSKEFNKDSMDAFLAEMHRLEVAGEDEVVILINSPGGCMDALKTMLDAIYLTEMRVITVGSGMVASCAILLLMAGDARYAFKDTDLMSHPFSTLTVGNYHKLSSERQFQDRTHKFMLNHYKLHTGLDEKIIEGILLRDHDVYLTAKEAKDLNIIDDIIIPKGKPIGVKARYLDMKKKETELVRQATKIMSHVKKLQNKEEAQYEDE